MQGLYEIRNLMSKLSGGMLTEAILMEATRDEIYTQYYDEHNGKSKRIPRDIFDKICEIGDVDNNPQKMSEFAKWLCDMYDTPKWKSSILQDMPSQWLKKDFATFRRIQKIKPEGVDLNLRNYDLETFMQKMSYVSENGLDVSKSEIKKMGADVIYQDNTWKVVNIKSREAAMFYGKGTTWCTSSRDYSHFYEDYSKRGLLIIFINLVDKSKYQGLFDFDCTWYEMKDEANDYFDETIVFPEEMFNYVTEMAKELVKERSERVWEDESEINGGENTINEFFSIYRVKRLERYRIRNEKTGEWLTPPHGNTFTDVFYYANAKLLFVEYQYGAYGCAFFIDGSKATLFEPDMRGHVEIEVRSLKSDNRIQYSKSEYFVINFRGGKNKILNTKERRYISINGKEDFRSVYQVGNFLTVDTFNEIKFLFSIKEHRCLEIDGTYNLTSVVVQGNEILTIENKEGAYIFNLKYETYFKYNGEKLNREGVRNGVIFTNIGSDNNPKYKGYCVENNTFLSIGGIDSFDSYDFLLWGRMVTVANYSDNPRVWLYNTHTNSFCTSENIPTEDRDIEVYWDGDVLFWGDNDILTCYNYENNEVRSLPVTIQWQDVHDIGEEDNIKKDKEQRLVHYNINGNDLIIYLGSDLRMILYKDYETGEYKKYDF